MKCKTKYFRWQNENMYLYLLTYHTIICICIIIQTKIQEIHNKFLELTKINCSGVQWAFGFIHWGGRNLLHSRHHFDWKFYSSHGEYCATADDWDVRYFGRSADVSRLRQPIVAVCTSAGRSTCLGQKQLTSAKSDDRLNIAYHSLKFHHIRIINSHVTEPYHRFP